MVQLASSKVVEPFGEVNVLARPDGSIHVRATILMRPSVEGAQTGLAIDCSSSMQNSFGASGALSPLFSSASQNIVEPVARTMAAYLANFDSDGKTTVIYWACGTGGNHVEEVGDMDEETASGTAFRAPKQFGSGTKLLPAIKYFTEKRFPSAPWSIFVFITDGAVEDLEDVKKYSLELAKEIAAGTRSYVKLVLIGVGREVDEGQMEQLDDLDYGGLKDPKGGAVDLWDHKLAAEMQKIEEIFAEVVSKDAILAPSAQVTDNQGVPVKPTDRASYADGLPALLDFVVPAGTKAFKLALPDGTQIEQQLA